MEHLGTHVRSARTRDAGDALQAFEAALYRVVCAARPLPWVTPLNAAAERARLLDDATRGLSLVPRWRLRPSAVPGKIFQTLDALRGAAEALPAASLHLDKLDELELDLRLIAAVGVAPTMQALARRRFPTGVTQAPTTAGPIRLRAHARALLDATPPTEPIDDTAADVDLANAMRNVAADAGLDIEVRVDPNLAALAAVGDRTVFVSPRPVTAQTAQRLAVHEVLGHLVSAERGRHQPLRVLEWGTAGAFVDQEGVAIFLEERHGLLDGARLRTLAARVLATDLVHDGASFHDTVTALTRDDGFGCEDALRIAERAHRGGGLTRDAGYLFGWLRVRDAVTRGACTLDALQIGRVSLDALPAIDALR